MRGTAWRWGLAAAITLASLVWQRVSGPTYPARGRVALGGTEVAFALERSHSIASDQPVAVRVPDAGVTGEIVWRRYPTEDEWRIDEMRREGDELRGSLPKQPPAGKLEYQVRLRRGDEQAVFPSRPAVTRFRGDVPAPVLVAHIAAIFLAMLFAARAGVEALAPRGPLVRLAWTTLALFVVGGFILGPAVQKYAFDAWWTGVPFGWDLTDNKTLVAFAAWAAAAFALRGGRQGRGAVLSATVVTLLVFAIPHSTWGSQIDWAKVKQETSKALHN